MKFELVDAEKASYPVEVLCAVLEVSRSGYYAWKSRPPSARAKADAKLAVEIAAAHTKSRKRYGSPRVHRALRRKGIGVSKKRVERLMREKGIVARQKRGFRRTTDSNHQSPIAPNVVERDFTPDAPNQVWAGGRGVPRPTSVATTTTEATRPGRGRPRGRSRRIEGPIPTSARAPSSRNASRGSRKASW